MSSRIVNLDLVRTRLYLYFQTAKQEMYGFSWAGLAERIAAYTGVQMDGENLRQFALRVVSKGRVRGLSSKNLRAVVTFLSDPAINRLSSTDLDPAQLPQFRLIRELLDFLSHGEYSEIIPPPQTLEGVYSATDRSNGEITNIELSLRIIAEGPAIFLTEQLESYFDMPSPAFTEWSHAERQRYQKSRADSWGIGIMTPEDNILIYMKQTPYPGNHYYMTIASDINLWSLDAVNRLVLLKHEYPLELELDDNSREDVIRLARSYTSDRVWVFQRKIMPA